MKIFRFVQHIFDILGNSKSSWPAISGRHFEVRKRIHMKFSIAVAIRVYQRVFTCILKELVFLWNSEEFSGIDGNFFGNFVNQALGK